MESTLDTVLYECTVGQIGHFFCPASYPHFSDTGPIRGNMIVFPRTSVTITHYGKRPIVGNPNVVMFYNQGQGYTRGKLSEEGDICDWFVFEPEFVVEALRHYDPYVDDRWEKPFDFRNGPSTSALYLQQHLLMQAVCGSNVPDLLYVEETMLSILRQAIEISHHQKRPSPKKSAITQRSHTELAENAKMHLSRHFAEPISLAKLATSLYTSPYHLCRVFRQETGQTIHSYLNQMRLHASLERIASRDSSLMVLSLALGFASHSHFTMAFRRAFGMPPSQLRKSATATHLQK